MYQPKPSKADIPVEPSTETNNLDKSTIERRNFLKKLGKYSAVTSTTTVTLMTASKVSALSPPPPPTDADGWQ